MAKTGFAPYRESMLSSIAQNPGSSSATQNSTIEQSCNSERQECSCEVTVVELAPEFIKKMTDAKVTAGEAAAFEIELSKVVNRRITDFGDSNQNLCSQT